MASSLSDDEFQRMQTQLLELRAQNYQLDDKCRRQDRELTSLRENIEVADKEIQKANKTINRSKKAKEFEILVQENDQLTRKLQSQEDDFRLQNETLMQELGNLVIANEELEKENKGMKEAGVGGHSELMAESEAETRRLQAQNSALQKSLTASQEGYDSELQELRTKVRSLQQLNADLETQIIKFSGQRGTPVGEGSSDRTVEGESDPETSRESQHDAIDGATEANTSIMDMVTQAENKTLQLEEQLKAMNDLKISLDTEREENKILKEELQKTQKMHREQSRSLQEEVEKLADKFKKKQESLVQLQEEKEKVYSELSKKIEDLQTSKDHEVQTLIQQSSHLQEELNKSNQVLIEQKEKSSQRIRELECVIADLEEQKSDKVVVDEACVENDELLQTELSQLQQQVHDLQMNNQMLSQHNDDLRLQLEEGRKANQSTLEQLHEAQQERDTQITALQEASKVAEKRKLMLDEMAIKLQKESEHQRDVVRQMQDKYDTDTQQLKHRLQEAQYKADDLEPTKQKLEESISEAQGLQKAKEWLERRLNESEENLKNSKEQYEALMLNNQEEHLEELDKLKLDCDLVTQELQNGIENMKRETETCEETINKLRQEIKDGVDERKIHEKKGSSMMKDLKRQLQAERKRAEKLQERLQEVLTEQNKANRQSMEELFRPIDPTDRFKGDSSSISSWSGYRDGNSSLQSPDSDTPPAQLEQENNDLVARLADLQKVVWTLEEKVSHLESSNAAMAEDILQKEAIIKYYSMDGRPDPPAPPSHDKMTLRRVMDFVKDKGDGNAREINRKLQRMLEETLTKNMHLQKDVEMLSEETVRLSKLAVLSSPSIDDHTPSIPYPPVS